MAAWEKIDKTKKQNCEEGRQERREEKKDYSLGGRAERRRGR